jgi:S-formylglutathione hydrolase
MAHGRWTQIDIDGRSADVFEPELSPEGVVIYLHGRALDRLVDEEVFTREFDRHRLAVVAPQGGRCWWLDTLCREFDPSVTPLGWIRQTLVPWIEERWDTAPPHIGLLGVSMGGQGVLQLAYRHARQFPVVAAIAPAIDFHIRHGQGWELDEMFADREAARQQTVTLHLHPLNWPPHQLFVCDPADLDWHEGSERLASKLASIGIPFERDLTTSAGGHSWEYYRAMAPRCIEFVARGLESVRTRGPRT